MGWCKEYLVKWRGYPNKFNSWVKETDVVKGMSGGMVLKELNMKQTIKVEHNGDAESNGKFWKLFGSSAPRSEKVVFVHIIK